MSSLLKVSVSKVYLWKLGENVSMKNYVCSFKNGYQSSVILDRLQSYLKLLLNE